MPGGGDMKDAGFGVKLGMFFRETADLTRRYFKALLLTSLALGLIVYAALSMLGVRPAGLFGVLAGALNLVPIVGPMAAVVLCVVIELFIAPPNALYVALTLILAQALDQFVLSPLIVGRSINFKPIAIFAVMTAASMLLGFWGLIFAVPLLGAVTIFFKIFSPGKCPGKKKD